MLPVVVAVPGKAQAFAVYIYIYVHTYILSSIYLSVLYMACQRFQARRWQHALESFDFIDVTLQSLAVIARHG